jgi:hypothetical protein
LKKIFHRTLPQYANRVFYFYGMMEVDLIPDMKPIPVTFDHAGKEYQGFLEWVPGAGGHHWDLMIDKRYRGMLLYSNYK